MLPDNQLASVIQSKTVQSLEAEPPVGNKAQKMGLDDKKKMGFKKNGFRGRSPLNPRKIRSRLNFLVQKVAQCSERNENLMLGFLLFEIWLFKILIFVPKYAQFFETDFLVYEIWSILYFLVNLPGARRIQKKCLFCFHVKTIAQALGTFGLNPSSHLVIGYHWLAFLNQIRKNLQVIIHYEC